MRKAIPQSKNKNIQSQAIKYKHQKQQIPYMTSPEDEYETNFPKSKSGQNHFKFNKAADKKIKAEFSLYAKMQEKLSNLQGRIEEIKINIHKRNLQRMKKNVVRSQQIQQQKKKLLKNHQAITKNKPKQLQRNKSQQVIKRSSQNKQLQQQINIRTNLNKIKQKNQTKKTNNENTKINNEVIEANKVESPHNNLGKQKNLSINIGSLVTSMPEGHGHAFEMNPYSPRSSIYYVSQVIKGYQDKGSFVHEHLKQSIYYFNSFSHIRMPLNEQVQKRAVNLTINPGYEGKKTIIFDLDQTLIHCTQNLSEKHQVQLPVKFNGGIIIAGINVRPGAVEILRQLHQDFQLIVFTASQQCYANVVIDHLDPQKKFIKHRLYRQNCYQTKRGEFVKDLRIINRQLKNMVLIDNAAYSYVFQPQNGIPIVPYYHGQKDYELSALTKYLRKLQFCEDVRIENRKIFKLTKYRDYKQNQVEKLVEDLYVNKQ